jgi:hypothetical protein
MIYLPAEYKENARKMIEAESSNNFDEVKRLINRNYSILVEKYYETGAEIESIQNRLNGNSLDSLIVNMPSVKIHADSQLSLLHRLLNLTSEQMKSYLTLLDSEEFSSDTSTE